ncbi:MAG: hypothetical protein U0234_02320 [Sandaracinus sp.]
MRRHTVATRWSHAAAILAAVMLASCSTPPPEPLEFVGLSGWTRFDRGTDPVHIDDPTGMSTVYIDRLPPSGATEFPVGTHVLRIRGTGDDPAQWEAHGMVKRGGDFNAEGAVGWEYYGLDLSRDASGDLVATTRWRGVGPPDGDGYAVADAGPVLGCNHCHGAATWNDSVIGDELLLTNF